MPNSKRKEFIKRKLRKYRHSLLLLIGMAICTCALIWALIDTKPVQQLDELITSLKQRAQATPPSDTFSADQIDASVIILGDGGDMHSAASALLRKHVEVLPQRTTVIFMGDNIYPDGLPEPARADAKGAAERLQRQIRIISDAGTRAIFIPGNHDWDNAGPDGRAAILRQQTYVEGRLGPGSYLPRKSCPGPEVADIPGKFRVVALDSQWWLHRFDKPQDAQSGCATYSKSSIQTRLKEVLEAAPADEALLVVTHHPFASYARRHDSGGGQTFGDASYTHMIESILPVLAQRPPLICAAGHDHNLQVLQKIPGCEYFLVSGALTNTTGVNPGLNSLFQSSKLGFMRVDRMKDASLQLSVFEVSPVRNFGERVFSRSLLRN